MVHFKHRPIFEAPLQSQLSTRDFRQVCPRAIFPVRVTSFPSRMLYIINIDQGTETIRHSTQN